MKLEFPMVRIRFRPRELSPRPFPRDGDIHSRILDAADRGSQALPDPGRIAAISRWLREAIPPDDGPNQGNPIPEGS
jgi:hypothetical protein